MYSTVRVLSAIPFLPYKPFILSQNSLKSLQWMYSTVLSVILNLLYKTLRLLSLFCVVNVFPKTCPRLRHSCEVPRINILFAQVWTSFWNLPPPPGTGGSLVPARAIVHNSLYLNYNCIIGLVDLFQIIISDKD